MGDFTRRPTAQVSFRDAELEKTETGKRDSLYHRNMSDMNTVDSGEVQPELFKERWLEGLIGGQDTEAQARRWAEEQTLLARKSNLEILNSRLTSITAAEALILSAFTQIYPRNPLQFNEPVAGSTIHFCSYGQTRHVCRALAGAGQIVAMAALLGTLGGLLNDIDFYRVLRKTRPNRKRFGNDPYRGVEHYKSDFRRVMKDMEEVSGGNDWCFFYVDNYRKAPFNSLAIIVALLQAVADQN